MHARHAARMKPYLHVELVTETYPPDVNGVALTVQSLGTGLRALGHKVALVRTEHESDGPPSHEELLTIAGAPLPRYPGLRFGLPAGRRLESRWRVQRPDAIYVATEGPLGWSALRAANRLGIPVATGFHTRFDDYVGRYGAGFLAPWVFGWLRRFHNRGDVTLVPTAELQQQLRDLGFARVQRLARAVDTRQFHPGWRDAALRAQWGLADDDLAVLCVGRLAVEKNLDLAIRAFRAIEVAHPRARLVLVGDGPQRAALRAAHRDVLFAGTQRGDALSRHFASADLFVFPSLSETFGNVTLEAMASGLPTVAFDYGAAREHLADGRHGALVAPGDAEGFVRAAAELASCGSLYVRGEAARSAVRHLHPDAVARDFALRLAEICRENLAA
jgi:glycosyltransferase involved in cell wall biosynthesis